MNELNNEKRNLFLIDDIGKETFSRKNQIDLKIMTLF